MAKKGKEIDLGGLRVQIDPLILVRRVLLRQKKLLALIAVLGGIGTIYAYKSSPKMYASSSQIAIRNENLQEDYVRNLANRAMRDLNSNGEMMLMINELDLFPGIRSTLPYEMALRRMRRELRVDRGPGLISVNFESKDPIEAQRVVAFVTERVLEKFANLLDSPYRRNLEALARAAQELEPKVKEARTQLFEFKAQYPEVAVTTPDFIKSDSPMAGLQTEIERAETGLKRCYAGATSPAPAAPSPPKKTGPACLRLKELQRRHSELLAQYTPSHPEVIAAANAVGGQEAACEREAQASGGGGGDSLGKPGQTQGECIELAKARIKTLLEQKVDIEKQSIKKPKLQRRWAELSLESSQLETQLRALRERQVKTTEDRLLAANDFQENFQLVDPAQVPALPFKPERNQFLAVGGAITALLGLLLATLREALRQSFIDSEEFEEQTGLQVLAVLPDIQE